MRRSRRGSGTILEFGGNGEDSFVAVVVTKLTGALLFILLLSMVIMALLPKADVSEAERPRTTETAETEPLRIVTPSPLPSAIAGRPYALALAASGAKGSVLWGLDGALPAGFSFDAETGILEGTPRHPSSAPIRLVARASDGASRTAKSLSFEVHRSDAVITSVSEWDRLLPRVSWRTWLERGFGFLVLLLVHLVAMNSLNELGRHAKAHSGASEPRFTIYRNLLRLTTLAAAIGLAAWLWAHRNAEPASKPEAVAFQARDTINIHTTVDAAF